MSSAQLSADVNLLVESLLRQMTLKEKIALLSGRDTWSTTPIERLGLPALVMTDGPHGVRANQPDAGRAYCGPATAFPTGIAMASTWNVDLVEQAGQALGEETRGAGCDILLGPCVNIIRTPIAGRNFEAYSEDPYLAGRIGVAYVTGVQSAGAGTSLKHYAVNNQEIERYRGSSELDERTLREIYLPHFEAVVREARPWTVMCSYNRINGVYASQHHHLLTEILREEWGFEGAVISDWTANHTTTESIKGGLDLEMPGPAKWYGSLLLEAVNIWQIEEAEIDRAARRILRMILCSGRMDGTAPKGRLNTPAHQALARQVAEEAITLLKNESSILPLKPERFKTLAVIGPAAAEMAISGGGSALVEPPHRVTPLAALHRALGDRVELRHEPGADNWLDVPVLNTRYLTPARGEGHGLYGEYFSGPSFEGEPFLKRVDPRLDYWWFSAGPASGIGARFCARWQGRLEVPAGGPYTLRLSNTGSARLFLDGQQVAESSADPKKSNDIAGTETAIALEAGRAYDLHLELINAQSGEFSHLRLALGLRPEPDDRIERAAALAAEADVVLVMVGGNEQYEAEGSDRPDMRLPGRQDELVRRVAEANPNTVVVLNTGSPVAMPWLDSVAAVVQAYFPGMEGGSAIAKVLTGEVNPSGRLTATYPRRLEDTPSYPNLSYPSARQVRYGEGIFVGYRYYDLAKVEPLFPFGHGLSYTTFYYSNLGAPADIKAGEHFEVVVDVTNTGESAGQEVVQLYVRDVQASVARPYKELKGFKKVALEPGETQTVRFLLDPRSLSFYDVVGKAWVAEPGTFEILVGASSADIRGRVEVRLVG